MIKKKEIPTYLLNVYEHLNFTVFMTDSLTKLPHLSRNNVANIWKKIFGE